MLLQNFTNLLNQPDNNRDSNAELMRLIEAYQKAVDFNIVCSITDSEGTIIYVNRRFCEVSKYSEEELLGQNHRIVNSDYHPKEFFKNLWETISRGKVWRGDVKSRAKDGSYFWLESTILPILDETGKIIQYFSLRIPIDDRKKLEQEREEHIDELEETLFMISHKVRLPVTHILGISELLNNSTTTQQELQKVADYMRESAEFLDLFTQELTKFIHKKKLKKVNQRNGNYHQDMSSDLK